MSVKDNKRAFLAGLATAKEKILLALLRKIAKYGDELLQDARFTGEYTSFTGNTLTSLAFGVYEDDRLTDIVFVSGVGEPIHAKVQNGQTLWLYFPYEGEPRAVKGRVDITDDWGYQTSERVLKELRPKGGNGIVITTGTEYSTFLEQVKDLNVLSDTFLKAQNESLYEMRNWIKPNMPIDRL